MKNQNLRVGRQEKANWTKAHRQAAQSGIVLTHRRNSKGEYVCYLNKKARNSILFNL